MIIQWSGPAEFGLLAFLSAFGLGIGLWSALLPSQAVVKGRTVRDRTLSTRIAHSLRDVSPAARDRLAPRVTDPVSIAGVVFSPVWHRVATWAERIIGASEQDTLSRAGVSYGHVEYRVRRLIALLGGGMAGLVLGGALGVIGVLSPLVALVLAATGAIAGIGLYDRSLRRRIRRRQERLLEEFPMVMELLALALSAGESLPGAIRRIASRGHGELATEWARVVRLVDLGAALGPTLVESARSMAVPEIEALTEHLAAALERGAPLAEVVRAHSSDSRLQRLRAIVDRAGKAEVAMLVPLVLLILPITVLFAVWPSLQALDLSL